MFSERDTNDGATAVWAGATRGGGGSDVGVIATIRVGSTSGLTNPGVLLNFNSGTGQGAHVSMTDDGVIAVQRHNSSVGYSRATGAAGATGLLSFWFDIPATMLTGTNPTVYKFTTAASTAISMTGATNVGGTAANMNGTATLSVEADSYGHWKIERVCVFVGADRPDVAAEARQVALGETAASMYTGLVFEADLTRDYVESVAGTTATVTNGVLEIITGQVGFLNQTCDIRRSKYVKGDNTGGPVPTFYDFSEDVPCMVQDAGSRESLVGYRQTGSTSFNVYFPCGQDVRTDDQLVISDGTFGTRTLAVVGPPVSDPLRTAYTKVPCEEIVGGGVA